MYRIMIVDDETIVRTSLATIVDWEQEGFHLVGDAANGKAALKLMEERPVDVVLTDIKMPIMDGLELIRHINRMETPPIVIVLSAYSDFTVARQAFKLGAVDYILKLDISAQVVRDCIRVIQEQLSLRNSGVDEHQSQPERSLQAKLHQVLLGQQEFTRSFYGEAYTIVCFEVEDFLEVASRFGEDLLHSLTQPLLNFAGQIPRVANRCLLTELSASLYILLYRESSQQDDEVSFIAAQIQKVWKTYMNITVTCGISAQSSEPESLPLLVQEALRNCTSKYIFGYGGIYGGHTQMLFDINQAEKRGIKYNKLIQQMKETDHGRLHVICQSTLDFWRELPLKEVRQECLYLIYDIAILLADCGDNLWSAFNVDIDFYQKIMRLHGVRDLEMWATNFARWISDYLENKFDHQSGDVMEKVQKFISHNYSDPGLTMKSVAEYVGFNEKYFSTRFNREMGMTFSSYLTDIRIQVAKNMLESTNMKSYEISEAVGYSNPEHFTRVFKKVTGVSPGAYRK